MSTSLDPLDEMFSDLLGAESKGNREEDRAPAATDALEEPAQVDEPGIPLVATGTGEFPGHARNADAIPAAFTLERRTDLDPVPPSQVEDPAGEESLNDGGRSEPHSLSLTLEPAWQCPSAADKAAQTKVAETPERSDEPVETPSGEEGPIETGPTEAETIDADRSEAGNTEALANQNGLETILSRIDSESLAQPNDDFLRELEPASKQSTKKESCVVFLLDGTPFAVPIRSVLEMDAVPPITAVPNVPGFVRGVTNLRGDVIAVIDLRTLFGFGAGETPERGRILVVRTTGQQSAAVAVDEVRGTIGLAPAEVRQPSSVIRDKVMSVLTGVSEYQDRILHVLDIDKLFDTAELRQFAAD